MLKRMPKVRAELSSEKHGAITRHCADLPGHQAGETDNVILDDQAKKAETESNLLEHRHVSAPIFVAAQPQPQFTPTGTCSVPAS